MTSHRAQPLVFHRHGADDSLAQRLRAPCAATSSSTPPRAALCDRRVDLPGRAGRRAGADARRRRARGVRRLPRAERAGARRAAPAARSAGRPSAPRSSSTTASTSTASLAFDRERATVDRRAGHRARRAQRLAAAARPVVPGRRQHVGAGDAGRHGRQQLLRLALDRLRQHGAQRASRSTRCSPTAARRASARMREMRERAAARCASSCAACARSARASATRSTRSVPKVLRRVGGYNLDIFDPQSERPYTDDGSVNFAHLLVGSEGTLAWTRALTLKLAPLPRHRVARRRQFPDAAPGDGVRAPHRRARARRRSSSSIAR